MVIPRTSLYRGLLNPGSTTLKFIEHTVNPPWRAYLFQAHLTGGLFNLEKMMVSVLHKELEYKVEKLKNKKVGGHAAEDQNQIRTCSW